MALIIFRGTKKQCQERLKIEKAKDRKKKYQFVINQIGDRPHFIAKTLKGAK